MNIEKALEQLNSYREKHIELGKSVILADGGAIYPLCLLVMATLHRSLCLLKGFVSLIEAKNFTASAPLIRLQLDNCLRLYAGSLVSNPHEFVKKIINGIPVRNQKDRLNKKMTDKYLVEKLTLHYAWIKKVYDNTSGYIHLSEKHVFNILRTSGEDHKLKLRISERDEFIPDALYIEAIEAFKATTDILLEFVYGWAYTKDNLEEAAKELRVRSQSKLMDKK